MTTEFAIIDDRGQQFGLPARTFVDRSAAESALEHLQLRRAEISDEAQQARDQLNGPFQHRLTDEMRTRYQEAIQRWENEAPRTYSVYQRYVGSWKAVAP